MKIIRLTWSSQFLITTRISHNIIKIQGDYSFTQEGGVVTKFVAQIKNAVWGFQQKGFFIEIGGGDLEGWEFAFGRETVIKTV